MGQVEQAPVKMDSVPRALEALGIGIREDPETNTRAIMIPKEVRQRLNVLLPVQHFAQMNRYFTPTLRVVELDVEAHAYEQRRGVYALNKQGLGLLAKCAGVLYQRSERVPRDLLQPGETFGYYGVIGIRRADGTVEELREERSWREHVERRKVEMGVEAWQQRYDKSDNEAAKEYEKRWLFEQEYGPGKTETKAILRAIRLALDVPHTFTQQQLQRPFLVIGYSFTPDYDDLEMKRLLVAHGMDAQHRLYGEQRMISPERDVVYSQELPAGDGVRPLVAGSGVGEEDVHTAPSEAGTAAAAIAGTTDVAGSLPAAGEQAPPQQEDEAPQQGEPEPPASEPEPPEQQQPEPPAKEPNMAVIVDHGRHTGKTLAEVVEVAEPSYIEWLASNSKKQAVREAATAWVFQQKGAS